MHAQVRVLAKLFYVPVLVHALSTRGALFHHCGQRHNEDWELMHPSAIRFLKISEMRVSISNKSLFTNHKFNYANERQNVIS